MFDAVVAPTADSVGVGRPADANLGLGQSQTKFSTFSCTAEESGVESPGTSETQSASSENGDFSRLQSEEETSDYPRSTPSPTSYSTHAISKREAYSASVATGGHHLSSPTFANKPPETNSSFPSLSSSLPLFSSLASSNQCTSLTYRRIRRTKSVDLTCDSLQHATRKRRRRKTHPYLERENFPIVELTSLILPQSILESIQSDSASNRLPSLVNVATNRLPTTAISPAGQPIDQQTSSAAIIHTDMSTNQHPSVAAPSTKRNDSDLDTKICKKVKVEEDNFPVVGKLPLLHQKTGPSQDIILSHYKLLHSSKLNSNMVHLPDSHQHKLPVKLKHDLNSKHQVITSGLIKDEKEDLKWRKVENELFSNKHVKNEIKSNGFSFTKGDPENIKPLSKIETMKLDFAKIKSIYGDDLDIAHEKAKLKMKEILMFDHSKVKHTASEENIEADSNSVHSGQLYICELSSQSTDSSDREHTSSQNDDNTATKTHTETTTAKTTAKHITLPPIVAVERPDQLCSNTNSTDAFEKTDSNSNFTAISNGLPPSLPFVNGDSGLRTPPVFAEDTSAGSATPRVFIVCKWKDCGMEVEDLYLLDHLKTEHLGLPAMKECDNNSLLLEFAMGLKESTAIMGSASRARGIDKPQEQPDDNLTCLWEGCKVYGAASSARGWLQKHITAHVGAKPFRCILDTCRARFSTQISLSRHVNSHFKPPTTNGSPGPRRGGGGHTPDATTPIKFYIRKARRKSRTRRIVRADNAIDLFDIGTMAGVKDALSKIKRRKDFERLGLESRGNASNDVLEDKKNKAGDNLIFDRSGTMIILQGKVVCKRLLAKENDASNDVMNKKGKEEDDTKAKNKEEDGQEEGADVKEEMMCLVEWLPRGILENEWMPCEDYKPRRRVPIIKLTPPARQIVHDYIFGHRSADKQSRKTRPYLGPPRLT